MAHSGLKLIEGVHNKLLEGLVDIMTVGGLCGRYSLFLRHVAVRYDRTDPWACCAHNGAPSAAPDGSQRLHTSLGDPGVTQKDRWLQPDTRSDISPLVMADGLQTAGAGIRKDPAGI